MESASVEYGNTHSAVGKHIRLRDEYGVWHDALITTVHGTELGEHCVNAVYVSDDPSMTDQYGRQKLHLCSLAAEGTMHAPNGRYYRVVDSVKEAVDTLANSVDESGPRTTA